MNSLTVAMLKAILAMLKGCQKEKVECASEILSQLIEHLETNPMDIPEGAIYTDPELDPDAQQAQRELMGE